MSEVLNRIQNEGIEIGKARGIEIGEARGETREATKFINLMIKNNNWTLDQVLTFMKFSPEERENYGKMLS